MHFELLTNILVGVLTGLLSSWFVTKFALFSSLRSDALRMIKRIDYIWKAKPKLSNHENATSDLNLIATDLLYFGHRNAGEKLLKITQELSQSLREASSGALSYETYDSRYEKFRSKIRQLKPTLKALV